MPPPEMTPLTNTSRAQVVVQYAGFWKRLGAYVIDMILLWGIIFLVSIIIGGGVMGVMGSPTDFDSYRPDVATTGFALGTIFMLIALWLVMPWLYFAIMESSPKEGTLGKMAVGLHVTDLEGRRISFGRATARFFSKMLSGVILGIGYIMAGFTEKKQALHDMVAGTLVLSKRATVPEQVAQNAFS